MVKLQLQEGGGRVYLAALEREHCRTLARDWEYDFENAAEPLAIGDSIEKADEWFEDIKKRQGSPITLGIFLSCGDVIGYVRLQGIDWPNKSCAVGMSIAKIANRGKGYGKEAVKLILHYGFVHLGLERISASPLEHNTGARKSLESAGFVLEGRHRKAVYCLGKKYDKLFYSVLIDEYNSRLKY